jgi:hypothetical protein
VHSASLHCTSAKAEETPFGYSAAHWFSQPMSLHDARQLHSCTHAGLSLHESAASQQLVFRHKPHALFSNTSQPLGAAVTAALDSATAEPAPGAMH